jgi:hypothetical protein
MEETVSFVSVLTIDLIRYVPEEPKDIGYLTVKEDNNLHGFLGIVKRRQNVRGRKTKEEKNRKKEKKPNG